MVLINGAVYGEAFEKAKRRQQMENIPSSVTREWEQQEQEVKKVNNSHTYTYDDNDNIEDIDF